jgi:Tesmin/TSO1-like CXC domain, cysteine-rich domain
MENFHRSRIDQGTSRPNHSEWHTQQCDMSTSNNHKYWRASEYASQHPTFNAGRRGIASSPRSSPLRTPNDEKRHELLEGLAHAALGQPQQQFSFQHFTTESSVMSSRTPLASFDTTMYSRQLLLRRHPPGWSRQVAWNTLLSNHDAEFVRQWNSYASQKPESMGIRSSSYRSHHSRTYLPKASRLPILIDHSRSPSPVISEVKSHHPIRPIVSRLKRAFEEEFTALAPEPQDNKLTAYDTNVQDRRFKDTEHSHAMQASMLDLLCSTTLELGPIQDNPTGCSCPRSNCIKLYCDCFKAGRRCSGVCACVKCKNTEAETRPDGERIQAIKNTLARNPRAFTGGKKEASPRNPGDIVCNCVKSKCLKLYCDCFQSGQFCNDACACNSCFNTKEESGIGGKRHLAIQQCLEKRADAFTKKIKDSGSGCACKNNKCLKKYCECFRMDIGCSTKCTCKGCENVGCKDVVSL